MAKGTINKVILVGRLGSDPEVRYTAGGMAVANLSVATSERRKDASGIWQNFPEWHSIVLFEKTAEFAKEYLKKGTLVYVEGRLQTKKYTDKSGIDRYSTEIIGNDVQMLSAKGGSGTASMEDLTHDVPPIQEQSSHRSERPSTSQGASRGQYEEPDVPF